MQLKNDLWDFALNFYQQTDIEQSCLSMQSEYDLSVNRLIFACWCGCWGRRLEAATSQADRWQGQITHPLRRLRYQVREEKQSCVELEACYQTLRQAELACEQVELAMLYEHAQSLDRVDPSLKLAEENLLIYLKSQKVPIDKEVTRLLRPLLVAVETYLGTNPSE